VARYSRFLGGVTMSDDQTRLQLAQVDHRDHEALTAVAADGIVAGISRYARLPQPWAAEVAVAVADRWRGRGIASLFLQQIAVRARMAPCPTSIPARSRRCSPRLTGAPGLAGATTRCW
jgi:GNAT superfamily N-acetyltransferase